MGAEHIVMPNEYENENKIQFRWCVNESQVNNETKKEEEE